MSAHEETLIEAAATKLQGAKDAAAPLFKNVRRQAGVLMDQSGELLESARTKVYDKSSDIIDGVTVYTRKHPLTALLLALGAGALLISATRSIQSKR